MQPPNIFPF